MLTAKRAIHQINKYHIREKTTFLMHRNASYKLSYYIHYEVMGEITYPFQTVMILDEQFCPTLYWACDYLSMLGLKLSHVCKQGPWSYISDNNLSKLQPVVVYWHASSLISAALDDMVLQIQGLQKSYWLYYWGYLDKLGNWRTLSIGRRPGWKCKER